MSGRTEYQKLYFEKVERRYQQCQKLEELFSTAVEVYIFLNSARLFLPRIANWSTQDGNGGEPLDACEYKRDEEVYVGAMLKLLDSNPGRTGKMYFIHLVIYLSAMVGYEFAEKAQDMIEEFALHEVADDRFYLARAV